jgi:hypothetical protein
MKEKEPTIHSGLTGTLNRRELLCVAAAIGGAMLAADGGAAASPAAGTAIADPRLHAAMLKYGGEFGQFGKGGSHGGL